MELFKYIIYFVNLSLTPELLWNITPLFIATILIVVYFEIYREESYVRSSYLSNSLVLIFVSMALFRYLFSIGGGGYFNLVEYPAKSLAVIFLLFVGVGLTKFNFEHVFPERFSKYISSPLTINLLAYGIILFVFASIKFNFLSILSLIFLISILIAVFNLIKFPIRKLRKSIEKEKKKERLKNTKEAIYEIDELKRELKSRDSELKQVRLKEAEKGKIESMKLKKIIRKEKVGKKK